MTGDGQERFGGCIDTFTGGKFWPLDPRPEEIDIRDIAHALSLQCRYLGHAKEFYSVAQHSRIVAGLASGPNKLWGLLHDAAEAYIGDMVRPIKGQMGEYCAAEARIMRAVAERFGLAGELPAEIDDIDGRMLINEKLVLFGVNAWEPPTPDSRPLPITVQPWRSQVAEHEFLLYFGRLAM